MNAQIDLTYQRVSVQNASPISLTILLYDRLVADIQAAIAAMRKGDIEKRCAVINHAYLILQQLQADLDLDNGGETAKSLEAFYLHLHSKLLEAQCKSSAKLLDDQIELILEVRSAWYQVESQGASKAFHQSAANSTTPQPAAAARRSSYSLDDQSVSSWSA